MLSAFCERMDQGHTLAYLETDKFENVGFYQRFGFRVIQQAVVLGIPNWFMSRLPTEDNQRRLLPEQHPIP